MADPGVKVDVLRSLQEDGHIVKRLGASERRNGLAKKPHPKSRSGNRRDGPAKRPKTPLAMEISVGKLSAGLPRKEA